jgi:hypothetical protein
LVQIWEILTHFGHGSLPASELAGLLSECGYKGDPLRAILEKADETRENPNDLKNHKSIIVRTAAKTMERRRRFVPETTLNICLASCVVCICCAGFFASMGAPLRL